MPKMRQLRPHTPITLTVNGFRVQCQVKHMRTQSGFDAVDEINRQLAAGVKMTGYLSRFGDHNIQINWD